MEFLPRGISFFKDVVANFSRPKQRGPRPGKSKFDFFKQLTFNFTESVSNDFQSIDAKLHRLRILNGCHVEVKSEEIPIFYQAVQFIDVASIQIKII